MKTLPHVKRSIAEYRDVDTITFFSEHGLQVTYVIQDRIEEEVFIIDEQEVECPENEDMIVDIDLASEETKFTYQALDGDEKFIIRYWPDNSSILDPYDQSQIDRLTLVYRFAIRIELPDRGVISRTGMAMWQDQSSIDFHNESLLEPYAFGGIQYDSVSFWRRTPVNGVPEILYLEDYVVVGFRDRFNRRWIREKLN